MTNINRSGKTLLVWDLPTRVSQNEPVPGRSAVLALVTATGVTWLLVG